MHFTWPQIYMAHFSKKFEVEEKKHYLAQEAVVLSWDEHEKIENVSQSSAEDRSTRRFLYCSLNSCKGCHSNISEFRLSRTGWRPEGDLVSYSHFPDEESKV